MQMLESNNVAVQGYFCIYAINSMNMLNVIFGEERLWIGVFGIFTTNWKINKQSFTYE